MPSDQLVGSLGVGLLLIAYALNVSGKISRRGSLYAALNSIGAGLACMASWMIGYYPFVVLEGTWTLVSFWALVSRRNEAGRNETESGITSKNRHE